MRPLVPFTLPGLLEEAAWRTPDAVAVSDPGTSWTFGELANSAAKLGGALGSLGVRSGDRVAVCARKSVRSIAALYGVMWAGAAYVPIDPGWPRLRMERILADSGCRAVCVDDTRHAAGLELPTLALSSDSQPNAVSWRDLEGLDESPRAGVCESDLAYLLYTSGSTGAPKGVMLTHRNALAFVQWAASRFSIRPADRLLSHAPFHFDLSVFDLYVAARAGASVHCLRSGDELLGGGMRVAVRELGLTVWYSVPSALMALCDAATAEDLASLRTVLFAGEVFPMKHLRRLRELVPQAQLANLYGPTETNVCTYHVVEGPLPPGDDPLPIGRACENQEVFALDDQQRPVSDGEGGELWVRGPTVMKGYWGDPEGTDRRLLQNPLHDRFPDLVYRTGDIVRRLPGGAYAFVGRRDHQIKSRGHRIELGEVENALISHPAVRDVAAIPVRDERLGALVVAFAGVDSPVAALELKRYCAERLPRYMVPDVILAEPGLPRTTTGKLDRKLLADRAAREKGTG